MSFNPFLRKRNAARFLLLALFAYLFRSFFGSSSSNKHEIKKHNVLERVTKADKTLDVQRHPFLQARVGRDEREGLFWDIIKDGAWDYWERFQKPFITSKDTAHVDAQSVRSAIEYLLSLNGWVAGACPTLSRPFGQNKRENTYDDLAEQNNIYFIAIVIHSADHFLVDQLAVIVQLAKRFGPQSLFVSMLDYDSTDSTPTLVDLCEGVLTLLSVPFRIRRVDGMTADPAAAYYPLEEAYARNLVLEPLLELRAKRSIEFYRVIWLKGFTCPNDILETIKVSQENEAAMVCGMDWAEHNGFFIFSDRWRTRDIDGDQFRHSKSSSKPEAGPPRDKLGSERYALHLPFQTFCCESGTHVVDPHQSYYRGITYRSGTNFHNLSTTDPVPEWQATESCLDSSQAWFCRDLWVDAARDGLKGEDGEGEAESWSAPNAAQRKGKSTAPQKKRAVKAREAHEADVDADAGSDFDAMPDSDSPLPPLPPSPPPSSLTDSRDSRLSVPNSAYRPARILVNPRCVTTYAGVSHKQLALDLFGPNKQEDEEELEKARLAAERPEGNYVLEDWETAPDSFVCQEQRQTGGRKATKTQRRLSFSIYQELEVLST